MRVKSVEATLPASDFERAKAWYAQRLGLRPVREDQGGAWYHVGATRFFLYPSRFAGTNQATSAGFTVDDVDETVAELRRQGVTFEEYDLPGLKTENGVATLQTGQGTTKAAWFKDSEGNILSVGTG
jgi:catechol 2,3-dioxygenase-like lactoylglutathione lyase family enzyme